MSMRSVVRVVHSASLRSVYYALILEALISGFYVVITRSLAPIFFAVYGLSIAQILYVNIVANAAALAMVLAMHNYSNVFVAGRTRLKLAIAHGLERVCWALIPVTAFYAPQYLALIYALAVTATAPTSILINLAIINSLDPQSVKKIFAYRNAVGAVSSILGQVVMVATLAAISSKVKYLYLYLLASGVGLIATVVVSIASIKSVEHVAEVAEEEALVKASSTFIFFTTLLAASSILGIAWGPHLIKDLHSPDYVAAMIGLIQTITNIGASLYWRSKPYNMYRYAIVLNSATPILVSTVSNPYAHLAIAALFAFTNTGVNFLGSFIFAEASRKLGIFRSSVMLTAAWYLSQVVGLTPCYVALSLGASTDIIFVICVAFISLSSFIAFVTLPEVALVKPETLHVYARSLYHVSIASYSFIMFSLRSYVALALKLLALAFAIMLLFIIYRALYYIAHMSG